MTDAALATEPQLSSLFRWAASFLAAATPRTVLESVFLTPRGVEALVRLASGLDHVGFIAPVGCDADLRPAASAAGFDRGHRAFASTILARELGELVGRPAVPTTVFRAWGLSAAGAPMVVEAFTPQDIEARSERPWAGRGVSSHVAFSVEARSHLEDVIRVMGDEGWVMPPFLHGEPMTNASEDLTAVYLDGWRDGRTVRLEYCHYGPRAVAPWAPPAA